MKKLTFFCFAVCAFLSQASAYALNFTIDNKSEWEIHELYLAPSESENWGPDQLGEQVISKGGTFTLQNIPEGDYWIKIVDEDGDSCVVKDIDFSSSKAVEITSKDLAQCQAGTTEEDSGEGDDDEE